MTTLADALLDRLMEWGVDTVFGIPGDQVNGVMEALRKRRDRMRFVHVRHEETASLAAVGYAKFTGRVGVCLSTAGPGAVHLLNGIVDAQTDRVPILALTGNIYHDLMGEEVMQATPSDRLFAPFTLFNERIMGFAHVQGAVDGACRRALAQRGPVHLTVPNDFQELPAEAARPSAENVPGHSRAGFVAPRRVPERAALEQAAALLASRRRIVILAGTGARGATAEIEALAERLGAPVIKALLGKDCFPDRHAYCLGATGHIATLPSKLAMDECDALVVVGSTMPFLHWYPKPGQAACVQIDDAPERIGLRYPVDAGLAGDARATLQALLPLLKRNDDRAFITTAQERMARWWRYMEHQGADRAAPMRPQVPASALSALLADDAILCGDAGTVAYWIARNVALRGEQRFSLSGVHCTMGSGLSYAIGAQCAYPGRQVVAFVGDGATAMLLGDLMTLRQHRLPVKLVMIRNNSVVLERWEQMGFLGNAEFGNDLSDADFAKIAEGCGISSVRIDDASRCREQLAAALSSPEPVLVECIVDPDEPALETPLVGKHAEKYAQAFRQGGEAEKRAGRALLERLREEKQFLPEAIDAPTAELMKALEAG